MTPLADREKKGANPTKVLTDPAPDRPITDFRVIRLDGSAAAPATPADPDPADTPPAGTAPRRAVPLAAPTAKELAAAREIAAAAARPRLAAKAERARARRPALESKLAGASDSDEMLRVMDVEVALWRARRLSGAGDKQREALRALSILMLFGLAIAIVGTMWYLQTLRQGHANLGRRSPAGQSSVTAPPAPATSAPHAAPVPPRERASR